MLFKVVREFSQADRVSSQFFEVDLIRNFIRPQVGMDPRVCRSQFFRFLLIVELQSNVNSANSAQLLLIRHPSRSHVC